MKRTLGDIGVTMLYILAAPFVLLLMIALIPLIILGGLTFDFLRRSMARLRRDPHHVPPKQYRIYTDNTYPTSEQELRRVFKKHLSLIERGVSTHIEVPQIEVSREDKKLLAAPGDVTMVTLTTSIRSETGSAAVEMCAVGGPGDAKIFSSYANNDFPPYLHVVYEQNDGLRTVFDIQGSEAMEFFIATLGNGQVVSQSGQVWTKLNNRTHMVNYTICKPGKTDRLGNDYGYRSDFSQGKARIYFLDKKL